MKKTIFLLYTWFSTILMAFFIYWLGTVESLSAGDRTTDEVVKIVYRMVLYAILFILFYRSVILTLKSTVERLATWRSKQEEVEDAEFVLIIETLVVIVTILATTIFSIFVEYLQSFVYGRRSEIKDVIISIMAILLTSVVVYSLPVIGELEIAIKHRVEKVIGRRKNKVKK